MKKWIIIVGASIISILFILLLAVTYSVEIQVKETCLQAELTYGKPLPEALILSAQSNFECTQVKSQALWAMGQLGDKNALPYLKNNFENLEETNLCIYEAQFAIEKIENNGLNLPKLFWRWTWQ